MLDFIEKVVLNTVGPVVALLLAALIGQRLSAYWFERQKRRELELALANTFYTSYGEFCAIWKYWNQSLRDLTPDPEALKERRATLLDRACKAEGGMEAALLKVAAERVLKKSLQKDLGRLRQAYQVLRERIQAGVGISYGRCDDPDYLEFKRLATLFGVLLVSRSGKKTPTRAEAYEAFREITHNKHEKRWKRLEKRLADSSHAEPNASCHRHGR